MGGLEKVLEALTGAYCEEAPEDAAYPYMGDVREL